MTVLLVASTGGHLAEAWAYRHRVKGSDDCVWITFESPQSLSLLQDEEVYHVPHVGPRAVTAMLRAVPKIVSVIRRHRPRLVVSTGSAVAVSAWLATRSCGVPFVYIESFTRLAGPSLSGRILSKDPATRLFTQHSAWASRRWRPIPDIFSEMAILSGPQPATQLPEIPKLFVTLGTIAPYRFDALVDAMLNAEPVAEYTWQLGCTDRIDLPGKVFRETTDAKFLGHAKEADLVVCHAGVGTLLRLINAGIHPLAVPRRAHRNEHVDDHQSQVAQHMSRLGFRVSEADRLDRSVIRAP